MFFCKIRDHSGWRNIQSTWLESDWNAWCHYVCRHSIWKHFKTHLSQISLVSAKNDFLGARTWICITRERYTLSRFWLHRWVEWTARYNRGTNISISKTWAKWSVFSDTVTMQRNKIPPVHHEFAAARNATHQLCAMQRTELNFSHGPQATYQRLHCVAYSVHIHTLNKKVSR